MYCNYFSLVEPPFSIVPDPRFLFMSDRHQEALAHLLYGVQGQGGFILVTGEVGTGKTTVCKGFLSQLPENTDVAYVINPKLSAIELLDTLCDELSIARTTGHSVKHYIDVISQYLLQAHAAGRHTVLMIDEAQNLSVSVLEQIRLLTNLETHEKKLLQIILIGQPELNELLQKRSLRQLTQRITARYHLEGLNREETESYVCFRLSVAGCNRKIFSQSALKAIYKVTGGIPRLINLVCDRALLAAYGKGVDQVSRSMVIRSAREVLFPLTAKNKTKADLRRLIVFGVVVSILSLAIIYYLPLVRQILDKTAWRTTEAPGLSLPPNASVDTGPPGSLQAKPENEVVWSDILLDASFAYNRLSSIWGVDDKQEGSAQPAGRAEVCAAIELKGLKCESKQGSWRAFLDINRPGVLKVFNPDRQENGYLVIKQVSGAKVLVVTVQDEQWLARSDIDRWWRGEFVYFWKLPPYKAALVRPGQPKRKSDWLVSSLATIKKRWRQAADTAFARRRNLPGYDVGAIVQFYQSPKMIYPDQADLKEQVRLFQDATGLVNDGIAGEMTQIRINGELDDRIPLLSPSISQLLRVQKGN
ncbi:MAG: general secretion pathway protein GspA [Gammaproteobacteria bacterium]|nr:MAG: general secretion pathway protein GspA [Gammaproteobacteria bacterium]